MYCYVNGDIFESPAQTLVNTINTVGAMGKGIAGSFKKLLPDMFRTYQQLCETGQISIGSLWLYRTPHKWILNFPTKKHWRYPSKLEYIEKGLATFSRNYEKANISSIAYPMLGCGNGELEWTEVKPLIEKYLKKLPIDIYIYTNNRPIIPEHKNIEDMRRWLMSEPRYYPFDDLKSDLVDLFNKQSQFHDVAGIIFSATSSEAGLSISFRDNEVFVPWVGDEISKGLLELWSLVRDKGICTVDDLSEIGIAAPDCVLGLLSKLPFIKQVPVSGKKHEIAIQLSSIQNQLQLFSDIASKEISQVI